MICRFFLRVHPVPTRFSHLILPMCIPLPAENKLPAVLVRLFRQKFPAIFYLLFFLPLDIIYEILYNKIVDVFIVDRYLQGYLNTVAYQSWLMSAVLLYM